MIGEPYGNTVLGGDEMCHRGKQGRKEEEIRSRQEDLERFNSVTRSVKPENQNQAHNVRKEGIGPINQKR